MNRGTKRKLSGTTLRSYAAMLVLAFLSACATAPQTMHASADPKNGDGIGGTGVQSAMVKTGGDGIGGTGIGNTGVRGTITGFGSILVNGLTLEFDHTTTVEIDGKPSTLEALKIGQIVQGVAQTKSGKLNLATIEIQHAVTGPISAINHAQETLTVLGQNVRLNLGGDKNATKAFMTLKAGDTINVSGLRQADGLIIATRVDQKSDEDRTLVRGTVTAVSATAIRIGDLDVPRMPDDKILAPNVGEHVTISGRMINGAFTPEVLVRTPPLDFDRDVTEVSLEAYAPKGANAPGPLSIDSINVSGAALPPGTERNARIVVTGRINGPNSLIATGIESVRTVVTINTARGSQRPAAVRPETARPERVAPRPDIERPQAVRPEPPATSRPTIERPQGVPLV